MRGTVFDAKDAFEGKDVCVVFPETLDACPARAADCRQSRADRFVYLRAAQAYMLISMPTGSSTIFGVFQLIRVSQVVWHDGRAGSERRSGADATQVRWTGIRTTCVAPDVQYFALGQIHFALGLGLVENEHRRRRWNSGFGWKEKPRHCCIKQLFALRHSFRDLQSYPCEHQFRRSSFKRCTRCVIPVPFDAAGSRRRRPTAISTRAERGDLAGNADR